MSQADRDEPRRQALHDYLAMLAGDAQGQFIELRYRLGAESFASRFFGLEELDRAAHTALARGRDHDVYVGCAPRVRQAGTKDAVSSVNVLWAECDGAAAARAALGWSPEPAAVVASGSGENLHAYWPLELPITPQVAEAANLRLAHALGADAACFDASRILRPPGTWNHKHRPPRPVTLLRLDRQTRYEADDVIARAPAVDLSRVEHRWDEQGPRRTSDPLLAIPPAVYVATLLRTAVAPSRKVRCPFHDDERPSLHVYASADRGWSCFSCRRGGSIYDLAANLWGLQTRGGEFIELRRRLSAQFQLEISAMRARGRP